MQQCSRNKLLVDLVAGEKKKRQDNGIFEKDYNVAGCVHPLRPQMTAKGKVPAGSSVAFAVEEACNSAGVRKSFMRRGIAQIGKRDLEKGQTIWRNVPRAQWKLRKLQEGELLRFRLLPEGGGGGGSKSPLRSILTIVVAVVAIAAVAWLTPIIAGMPAFAGAAPGTFLAVAPGMIAGVAGLAVSTIGMVLVNAIAPIKAAQASTKGLSASSSESQVYSISSGKNSINQWGRVPVPLGRGRFAPPKAASPYTQTIGEDIYLHELLCPGIGNLDISDIKIGTTPIEEYVDCQYELFRYDPANPKASNLYPTGVYQQDLSVQLKSGVWNSRTTAECDSIELDFSFQGLCYYNDDSSKSTASVDFVVQYRKKDTITWNEVATRQFIPARNYTIPASSVPSSSRTCVISANTTDGVRLTWDTSTAPSGDAQLGVVTATKTTISWTEYVTVNQWGDSYVEAVERSATVCSLSLASGQVTSSNYDVSGFGISLSNGSSGSEATISVSGGYLTAKNSVASGSYYITYSGAQSRMLRKTYTITPPERGVYDVRVRRTTDDSNDDRLVNASYWGALRSVSNDKPVDTDYPVNLLAIKIKATSQLSGAIDTLTLYYESKIKDWDVDTQTWITRYSSNPASIFRHILQDSDSFRMPQADSLLDLDSIQDAHEYWKSKGWNYNFVCDADVSVFERLQSVCAAGLASPTMVDGKWGIILDKPRTSVACAFTSANSWGWSFKRTQVRLPNAIHCTFINQNTWDSDMRVVPTDEVEGDTYKYESQEYEGVNDPSQVYQLARFHYADAKNRRRTISLRCLDEALLCTRGDLVDCAAPNISPHGLQVGRVRGIERDEDENVVALYTDQTQTTDLSGRRFGVKVYAQSGAVLHAEVLPENVTPKKLTLIVPQAMDVNVGDKYAFGDYSEETFPAIVLGLKPNSDWTFDVTLQDYVPTLYDDLSKPIPTWESSITTPISSKWKISSTPIFQSVVTDESALLQTASGTIPRILISYAHPANLDTRASFITFEVSPAGQNVWTTAIKNASLEPVEAYISGVTEGQHYDVRAKYSGTSGQTSDYVYAKNVKIIGRTTRPPAPFAVYLNGATLNIQQKIRPLDIVGHKVYMAMDEEDAFEVSVEITNPYTVTGTFELSPWTGKARAIFVTTVDEIGLESEPVRLVVDLGDVSTRNILFEYSEKDRGWGGIISGGFVSSETLISDEDAGRYPQTDSVAFYPQMGTEAFYSSGTAATLSYIWSVAIPANYKDARVLVLPEITSGKLSALNFRHLYDVALHSSTDSDAYYSQDNDDYFYAQYAASEWSSMPAAYVTPGSEILQIQTIYANTEAAAIQDIKTVIDVEDKSRDYQDILISSDGLTRAPVPTGYFKAITTVRVQLQYVDGSTAVKTEFVKGSETLDSDGYIALGPYIHARNSSLALTTANCDITVYGY